MSNNYEYFGKYILLEKLASGGMAEVFLARAPGAGGIAKFVAIKRILPQFSDSKEFVDMFKEEAKIAINLSHSNIVSIYEFGVENGQFFLVMDYVEGRNIRQILNKMKQQPHSFSIEQVVYVIKDIAAGLDHAHRSLNGATGKPLNITHRDMSPQNVMISFEGEAKIIDFGIAKAESQLENTRAGTLKGKFGYMSPEQAEGQNVDLRTDIFSLGIVLWELLANDRLFIANNEINTLRKIRDCQIPSLTKINPNVHPELERICLKALTKDRNHRYQTAANFHKDLNRFLNRQYPDFSSHDFSMFIKSIYAEEILETRNRLIEYAQIPFREESPVLTPVDDKTLVIPADNSATKTDTSFTNESSEPKDPEPPQGFSPWSVETGLQSEILPNNVINADLIQQQINAQKITQKPSKARAAMTPMAAESLTPTGPKKSDLTFESTNIIKKSPAKTNWKNQTGTYTNYSSSRVVSLEKEKSGGFFSKIMYIIAIVGCYLFLTSYFPQEMQPIHKATTTFLGTLGIEISKKDPGGNDTQPEEQNNIKLDLEEQSIASEAPQTTSPTQSVGLVINSKPSGAEIFLNGASIGRTTPSRVQLNDDEPFSLSLRKKNYQEFSLNDVYVKDLESRTINADLQKIAMAYLDIDVQPPRFSLIYINGKLIDVKRLPILRYPVPAGTELTISARNQVVKSSSSTKVILDEGQRKSVVLVLKRSSASSNLPRK